MRIDAHQHFWQYDAGQFVWMTDALAALRQDFLPAQLAPLLESSGVAGTVAVQARQSLEETDWLLALADRYAFIRGVVGWVDLCAADVAEQLERCARHPKLRGVRHLVHDEPDVEFMLGTAFRRGIRSLARHGLTYDLLLRPMHLPIALKLAREFPDQPMVVDHLAKPLIAQRRISPWREDIKELASCENVYCKLSGMVTEAEWRCWRPEDFTPYLDVVLEAFGPRRLMIGSDWPVCTLSADYGSVLSIVTQYALQLSPAEQSEIEGGSCARFYSLLPCPEVA
jgi:L-fuconolactonase